MPPRDERHDIDVGYHDPLTPAHEETRERPTADDVAGLGERHPDNGPERTKTGRVLTDADFERLADEAEKTDHLRDSENLEDFSEPGRPGNDEPDERHEYEA